MKLYRGQFDTTTEGYWYTTWKETAKRYIRGMAGYIVELEIDIIDELEGQYKLTRDVASKGHHDTFGRWDRPNGDTWFYISPKYLNEHTISKNIIEN